MRRVRIAGRSFWLARRTTTLAAALGACAACPLLESAGGRGPTRDVGAPTLLSRLPAPPPFRVTRTCHHQTDPDSGDVAVPAPHGHSDRHRCEKFSCEQRALPARARKRPP